MIEPSQIWGWWAKMTEGIRPVSGQAQQHLGPIAQQAGGKRGEHPGW